MIVPWLVYRGTYIGLRRGLKILKVARVFNALAEEMKATEITFVDDSECISSLRSLSASLSLYTLVCVCSDQDRFGSGADAFKESDLIYRARSALQRPC